MPKKIKNCFYKNLTFQKLMEAHKRARVHKAYKSEIITFEFNLENNITNLLNNIKNKSIEIKRLKVQYADAYAHAPSTIKKRILRLNSIKELI